MLKFPKRLLQLFLHFKKDLFDRLESLLMLVDALGVMSDLASGDIVLEVGYLHRNCIQIA